MKTPKSLYSRLALITSVTLVVGYFVVYAVYENINSEEVASNAIITSTLMGKIKNNLDTLNTQVTDLTATVVASSIWSKVGSDINYTAGKVGIGATTGNAELDIQSGIKPHWGIYHDSTTEELRFWNGDNRVVIGSTGKVGIGTGSPEQLLHLKGPLPYIAFQDTEDLNGSKGTITSNQDGYMYYDANQNNTATKGGHYFRADGATKFLLSILNNGNVGIGTSSPSEKVRIGLIGNANAKTGTNAFGSAGLTYLQFDTTTTNNEVGIFGGEGMGSLSSGIGFARESNLNWGMQLRFYTKQTAVTTTDEVTERMRIMGDGNVGIGTTSPTQKLDVNGMIGIHSTVTTSLIGNIRMEDNLFKIVTPSQKQWEFRDDGTIWFYDGISWTKKSL